MSKLLDKETAVRSIYEWRYHSSLAEDAHPHSYDRTGVRTGPAPRPSGILAASGRDSDVTRGVSGQRGGPGPAAEGEVTP